MNLQNPTLEMEAEIFRRTRIATLAAESLLLDQEIERRRAAEQNLTRRLEVQSQIEARE